MEIAVLGSMKIIVEGAHVDLTSATQRRILAALVVCRGQVVAPERLADMAGVSRRALRTAISRIRSEVGDRVIATRPEGYTLGPVDVDVDRFEAQLEEARRASPADALGALDSALALWRGDPFGDCVDTEWAPPVAARLAELFASAIEDRGETLIARGRYADASAAMAIHSSTHRLRDRPVELLMRALAAQGRQSEALRQFREHRRRLMDEIGVEPGDQLAELDAKIATGWHDTPPAGVDANPLRGEALIGNLRPMLTSFIGRDREVGEVIGAVAQHRLVTLIGVGGVGKTRLAIESALESGRWPDGAWLVELGAVESDDEVADAVARVLGIRQTPGLSLSESILRWCHRREMLLILDNCEHVLRSTARLAEALTGATDAVRVVATSREALMVPGEHVQPVSVLALPEDEGGVGGAVELFVDRARSELSSFDPSHHHAAIADICRRLDGLPLALELAAARVRGLSVEDIASRLDERFRLLTGGRRTAIERHATLRATVDWSYGMLADIERSVFCSLSVFAGPFTLDDAVAVADDDIDELDAVDALAHLVDRCLVVRGDTPPEYRLLETLRAYGRERLDAAGAADLVGRRHAALMARKAARARNDASGPGENDVVRMLRAQIADYGSAVNWAAAQGDAHTAVRIAEDLFVPVSLWGDNGDPGRWMCGLLEIDFSDPTVAAANRFMAATWHLFFGNDAHRAIALATEAVELDPACAMAHVMATFGAMFVGRAQEAVLAATAAQGLACDASEEVFCFIALGNALLNAGHVGRADLVADAFIAWAEDLQYPTATGMAYHLKGRTLAELDGAAARECFERGLAIVREEIPGCWIVDTNLKREMVPLVHRTSPADAPEWALASLRESVRHNETGNLLTALAYAAIVVADGGLDEVAARAIGAAGPVLLAPRDTVVYERTVESLGGRLGTRYEELVADGSGTPIMSVAQDVIEALGSLRAPVCHNGHSSTNGTS